MCVGFMQVSLPIYVTSTEGNFSHSLCWKYTKNGKHVLTKLINSIYNTFVMFTVIWLNDIGVQETSETLPVCIPSDDS